MKSGILIPLAGMILGIIAGSGVMQNRTAIFMAVCCFVILPGLILLLLARKQVLPRWFTGSSIVAFLCFGLAGFFSIATNRFKLPATSGEKVHLVGKVVESRKITERMEQVIIRPLRVTMDSVWQPSHGKVVFNIRPDPKVLFMRGDVWQFGPVRIAPVSSKPAPGGFVASRYWRSRGVEFEGWLYPGQSNRISSCDHKQLKTILQTWQSRLTERIDGILLSDATSGLLKAMLFGDRKDLDDSLTNTFNKAGIIHVLSVSGLHVGIIYLIIGYVLKWLNVFPRQVRTVICLTMVWMYTGISGLSPSACRAAGMVTLFGVAGLTGRSGTGLDTLGAAAVLHCLIDPFVIFSAGAQLSYLAVAGIFLWMPMIKSSIKGNTIKRKILEAAGVSFSAQSLIIPVLLFWFGWFPLYFLAGNLALVPLLVLGFYAGLALVGIDATGLSVNLLGQGLDFLVAAVIRAAEVLGNLPGNYFKPEGLGLPDMMIYYCLILSAWYYLKSPKAAILKKFLGGTAVMMMIVLIVREVT